MSKVRKHIWIFTGIFVVLTVVHSVLVAYIDPFFHYHAPLARYYYDRDETIERYCNDGVLRHFDYDALITGVSVCQGFSTSEFDELFDARSEKVIYSGGTFKESAEGIRRALESHPDTKIVFCSLFLGKLKQDKDHRRSDIVDYPTYLYNNNIFDDVNYLLNKDVLFNYIIPMLVARREGKPGGVKSLDTTSYLHVNGAEISYFDGSKIFDEVKWGIGAVEQKKLNDNEKIMICDNIKQNILDVANEYPNTRFIYFVPPCSIIYYKEFYEEGELETLIDSEEIAIKSMLAQNNIEVYSFNDRKDIIENLDNYSDSIHYGGWINSFILEQMARGDGRIDNTNVDEYMQRERDYFYNYNY